MRPFNKILKVTFMSNGELLTSDSKLSRFEQPIFLNPAMPEQETILNIILNSDSIAIENKKYSILERSFDFENTEWVIDLKGPF
ncbi:MAG: hypothetical protein JEZ08_16590 [Clostridiales bacterium]|nr:hypothetical protein [Clostridiales bacterium]